MQQMQGLDASFVALERPHAPLHIGSIIIYDPSTAPGGFVRFKDILEFITNRLQLAKTWRQRMVKVPFNIDYPYWIEDPDFDLEYHVRHIALPEPGDWRQLCILAARIFARPLDLDRPPWEVTIVGGLDNIEGVPKGSYALLSKVHHAAIDGVSGVDLMHALHTLDPSVEPPTTPDDWKPDSVPGQARLFTRGYFRALLNPMHQLNALRNSVPGLYRATLGYMKGDFDFNALSNAPRTRFNEDVSPHRVVDGRSFELSAIKDIRALSPGCKINDVMLSIVGGAMRKYLTSKEELPDSSLIAMAPISVRDESEKNTLGNQVSAMFVPLGSQIVDPVERLRFVHAETHKSKSMTNALGARQMTEMSKLSPALFLSLGARLYTELGLAKRMKPTLNTVVTNVPGPPIPLYSAGAKMVNIYGKLCLLDGMALGHVVQSYVDKITICFTACRQAVPDPAFYAECLQEAFDEYLIALSSMDTPAKEKKAARKKKKFKTIRTVKPSATPPKAEDQPKSDGTQ